MIHLNIFCYAILLIIIVYYSIRCAQKERENKGLDTLNNESEIKSTAKIKALEKELKEREFKNSLKIAELRAKMVNFANDLLQLAREDVKS